jgi:hypothetical protein
VTDYGSLEILRDPELTARSAALTTEYCDPTGRKLKESLQTEFEASGFEYVRNWGEAVYSALGSEE